MSCSEFSVMQGVLIKVLLLSLSCGVLTSCALTTYEGLPPVEVHAPALPQKDFPLYYNVDPNSYLRQAVETQDGDFFYNFPARLEDYDELRRVFAEGVTFPNAIATTAPPPRGVYCEVRVDYIPLSDTEATFLTLSHFSGSIIPSFNRTSGHRVRYDLYVDQALAESYEYTISVRQGIWVVLIPFSWINLLTPDLADVFRATAYKFFLEASLDGHLRVPKPKPQAAAARP